MAGSGDFGPGDMLAEDYTEGSPTPRKHNSFGATDVDKLVNDSPVRKVEELAHPSLGTDLDIGRLGLGSGIFNPSASPWQSASRSVLSSLHASGGASGNLSSNLPNNHRTSSGEEQVHEGFEAAGINTAWEMAAAAGSSSSPDDCHVNAARSSSANTTASVSDFVVAQLRQELLSAQARLAHLDDSAGHGVSGQNGMVNRAEGFAHNLPPRLGGGTDSMGQEIAHISENSSSSGPSATSAWNNFGMSGSGSSLLEGSMPDYDTRRPYIGPGVIGQNNVNHEYRAHTRPPHVNFASQRDFTRFNDNAFTGYGQSALTRYGQEQLRRGTSGLDPQWSNNPLDSAVLPSRAVTPATFGIPNLAGPSSLCGPSQAGSAVSLPAMSAQYGVLGPRSQSSTMLSPMAAEFRGHQQYGPSPWNAQPREEPQQQRSQHMPLAGDLPNYRSLLDRSFHGPFKPYVDRIVYQNDQQSSIALQHKLKVATPQQKYDIVTAIIDQAQPLMINRFGNFLVQRCFEHGTPEQVMLISRAIRGHTVNLSMDAFGCHVVQKAFDFAPEEYKALMVHELLANIPETVIHRYACHVWQKLFELRWNDAPPQIMKYVNEALRGMWHEVALGETGSLVVQNIFENCVEEDKRPCITEVLASIDVIAHGQFGNWCIQHVCEHGAPADQKHALDHILRFAVEYSVDQFASKVVEKCLKISGPDFLDRYLDRVCDNRHERPRMPLIDIAGDQYGNYLIQFILQNADPHRREIVAAHLRKHIVSLRGSKYGSRVAMFCSNPGYQPRNYGSLDRAPGAGRPGFNDMWNDRPRYRAFERTFERGYGDRAYYRSFDQDY